MGHVVSVSSFVRWDVGSRGPFQALRFTDSVNWISQLQGDIQKPLFLLLKEKEMHFFLALYFVIFHASSLIFGNFLPKALQPALLHVGSPQKKNKYLRNHNPKVSYCLWGCLSPSWLLKSFQMSGSRKMTLKYFYFFPVRIMLIPRHQNPFWTLHCRPVGGSHHCILFVLGLGERNLGTFWTIG